MLANRIRHSANFDSGGNSQTKLCLMRHGGVVGNCPHVGLSGLNIINAHTVVAMAILKGAGVDFVAATGSSGLILEQKLQMNWAWLRSCISTSGGYLGTSNVKFYMGGLA